MNTESTTCVDFSFVRRYINFFENPKSDSEVALLEHPAMQSMVQHQRASGAKDATAENTFQMILKNEPDIKRLKEVLQEVEENDTFGELWKESAKLLPKDFKFVGKIYFIIGYDIGVANPPDILINLAHPKILRNPSEIEPYIIHESHHIGFFQHQKIPALIQLETKENLLNLIKWATHSEGMAVHSAYNYRKKTNLLKQDIDYRVYFDRQEKESSIKHYSRLFAKVKDTRGKISDFGSILSEMSSESRLWYKFGALVSHAIVEGQGATRLIESISKPQIFWSAAEKLLENSD